MTDKPSRVIDAHVHLWDPARPDWYPYLASSPPRMGRRFDIDDYRSESAGWNVEKFVNVAAATGRNSVDETIELDRRAEEGAGPDAIIGGLPPTESTAEAIHLLDHQMQAPRFRGVRPMGGLDRPVPDREVLGEMEARSLVFEVMAHPHRLREAAAGLAGFDRLTVVVEHTGWPRTDSDEERATWRDGIAALADLGDGVFCKLSGLSMPFQTMDAAVVGPWIEYAIETFGVERCMFASNFPVDSVSGTFDQLYSTFDSLTSGLGTEARAKLFADNAARAYRL